MGLGGSEEEKRRRKRTLARRNTGAVTCMEAFPPRVSLFEPRGTLNGRQSVRTSLPYGTMGGRRAVNVVGTACTLGEESRGKRGLLLRYCVVWARTAEGLYVNY